MSLTPLSIARIAGEVGLAGGTITGGCCAAKYSSQASRLYDTRGALRTKGEQVMTQVQNVNTYWEAYSNAASESMKKDLGESIKEAYRLAQEYGDLSCKNSD